MSDLLQCSLHFGLVPIANEASELVIGSLGITRTINIRTKL